MTPAHTPLRKSAAEEEGEFGIDGAVQIRLCVHSPRTLLTHCEPSLIKAPYITGGLLSGVAQAQGARWRPISLTPGNGALALLDNAVSIHRQPTVAFPILSRVANDAQILKGVRGEASQVVDSILKNLDHQRA